MPSIGRLFYEVGAKNTMPADLAGAVKSFESFGETVSASGKRYLSNFQQFINPTKRLSEELILLEKSGAKPAEMLAFLGDRFQKGVDQARKFGETIPKNVLELEAFAAAGKKSGISFEGFGAAITNFAQNPMMALKSGVGGVLESLGPMAVGIGSIAAAAIAGGSALIKMAADAAATAEQLENLSIQTGLTTQDLQALQQIGKEKGVELDLAKQLGKLNKELADVKGTGSDFVRTLNALRYAQGLGAADLSKGLFPALVELRERVLAIENPFEQSKAKAAALGKGMQSLQPIIFDTTKSIADMVEEQKKTDAVWGVEAQNKLKQFDDMLDSFSRTWKGLKNDIAIATVNALHWFGVIESKSSTAPTIQQMYEQWAKAGKGLPQFGISKFVNIGGIEGDPFKNVAAQLARADAIAQGEKVAIELRIKLKQVEEEYAAAKKDNDIAEATRLAALIDTLKERIKVAGELQKLSPSDQMMKSIKAAQEAGASQNEIIQLYGKSLIEANSKQIQFNKSITDEAAVLAVASLEMDHAKEMVKALTVALVAEERYWTELRNTESKLIDVAKQIEEQTQKLKDLTAETTWKMGSDWEAYWKRAASSSEDGAKKSKAAMENIGLTSEKESKKMADQWKNQISTIVTDFSRGFADILFAGKSFAETLKAMFIDMGKSIVRSLMEILFVPLQRRLVEILTSLFGVGTATAGGGGSSNQSILNPNMLGGGKDWMSGFAGIGMGGTVAVAGMFQKGVAGWAETIGGGAAAGAALGTYILPGIGTALGAALGAAAGAIAKGIQSIVRAFTGPSTIESAVQEAIRDLGGTRVTEDAFKTFIGQFIDPSRAWGIRKDLMVSPAFLAQVVGPAAEAQGQMPAFLKSLEQVRTSWGTFNFREAFELGKATGDWAELNKQFATAFEHSHELQKLLPNWKTILSATAETIKTSTDFLVESFKGLRDSIADSITPVSTMYQKFMETGEITKEFAAKITELGGDISKFSNLADLAKVNDQFGSLTQHFRDTGEILPGLRDLFAQFGGSLKALDDAADLSALKSQMDFMTNLAGRLQALQPAATALDDLFRGILNTEGLIAQGLDPSKFQAFTNLTSMIQGWQNSISQFQQTGILSGGGIIEQALAQFGGTAGATALSRFGQGFNTITPALLTSTFDQMQRAYQAEITRALDYLGTVQQSTTSQIEQIASAVEGQFTLVGDNITTTLDSAKTDVVSALDLILEKITEVAANTAGGGAGPPIIINGDVYGYDDFQSKVGATWIEAQRRGAFGYVLP